MELDEYEYAYMKGINALIFCDNFEGLLSDFIMLYGEPTKTMLELFKVQVIYFSELLDDNMKENVIKMANFYQDTYCKYYPEEREEIFRISNEIKGISNSSRLESSHIMQFITIELYRRGYSFFERVKYTSKENIDATFDYLKKLQVQDFLVLLTHILDENSTYFNQVKPRFTSVEEGYTRSVEELINECPLLLKNKMFFERLNIVLDELRDNINSATKEASLSKRVLKKDFKFLNNLINEKIKLIESANN